MDLPLLIPRFMVRKMVNQAYEEGKQFQAYEDARAVTDALKEVVSPKGLLLQQQDPHRPDSVGHGKKRTDIWSTEELIKQIDKPLFIVPKKRDDDCGDYHRWPR